MNKRVLLPGVFGAVAMFVWTFIAHMALPLGENGIQQISNEQQLLDLMSTTIPSPGMYIFPNMPPGGDQAVYEKRIASGPSGLMTYFPKRDFNFGKALGIEFATELVEALLAAYLLSLTTIASAGRRIAFYATLGLCAVLTTNISYWNWYGFVASYTASYMFTIWFGFVCAGLVAALLLRRKTA